MLSFLINLLILLGCILLEINLMSFANFSILGHTLKINFKPKFKPFNVITEKNSTSINFTNFVILMVFTCIYHAIHLSTKWKIRTYPSHPKQHGAHPLISSSSSTYILGGSSSHGHSSSQYSSLQCYSQ